MDDLTNLKSCQLSNLDENMIQLMILPKKSATAPSVISLTDAEVVAIDGDELKKVDQFHGEVLEKPWKLISCGNKSSQNGSLEQEVSICQTCDIMANPEDDENNPDYTRSNDRIIKSSSTDSRRDMPEHVLFDILLLLPIITLLRFKSICKSWYALIGSSVFIAQHFEHNCSKDNLLCFLNPYEGYPNFNFVGYKFCLLSGNKYEVYNNFDCGQCGSEIPPISLALSSNGIICLIHSDSQEVSLWNPATKQLRHLPKSSVSYQAREGTLGDWVFFGFGHNVKSDDYKIVRTIRREGNLHNNAVEVYSLRDDSWRTILKDAALPFTFLIAPISKNGTCFWISHSRITVLNTDNHHTDGDEFLVSFDLNDETYGTMPLPGRNETSWSSLEFLSDKLAYMHGLLDFGSYGGPSYYEIWVLREYGVKESWSKVWKIGPTYMPHIEDVRVPFGFSKNGDYLLLTDGNGEGLLYLYYLGTEENEYIELQQPKEGLLYLYYLGTEENEYIELQQPKEGFDLFPRYTESLVSVKRVNDAY